MRYAMKLQINKRNIEKNPLKRLLIIVHPAPSFLFLSLSIAPFEMIFIRTKPCLIKINALLFVYCTLRMRMLGYVYVCSLSGMPPWPRGMRNNLKRDANTNDSAGYFQIKTITNESFMYRTLFPISIKSSTSIYF